MTPALSRSRPVPSSSPSAPSSLQTSVAADRAEATTRGGSQLHQGQEPRTLGTPLLPSAPTSLCSALSQEPGVATLTLSFPSVTPTKTSPASPGCLARHGCPAQATCPHPSSWGKKALAVFRFLVEHPQPEIQSPPKSISCECHMRESSECFRFQSILE